MSEIIYCRHCNYPNDYAEAESDGKYCCWECKQKENEFSNKHEDSEINSNCTSLVVRESSSVDSYQVDYYQEMTKAFIEGFRDKVKWSKVTQGQKLSKEGLELMMKYPFEMATFCGWIDDEDD
jgi:hypothetical protein